MHCRRHDRGRTVKVEPNVIVGLVVGSITVVLSIAGLVWAIVNTIANRSEDRLRQDRRDSETRLREDFKEARAENREAHAGIVARIEALQKDINETNDKIAAAERSLREGWSK